MKMKIQRVLSELEGGVSEAEAFELGDSVVDFVAVGDLFDIN